MHSREPAGANCGQPRSADFAAIGRIVTMNSANEIIPDGAVVVIGSSIAAVGPRAEVLAKFSPRQILGDQYSIITPGLIDGHTHCTQCFVRAMTAGELPMIPRIYNPAQRSLSSEQAASTVRLIAAQLLRSGVTTLCEGTLNPSHEDAIIDTLQEVGIRCVMARGKADQDFHHAALYEQLTGRSWVKARQGEAEQDLLRTEAFLNRFPPNGDGLIRGAVNASALPGFSETYFKGASDLARKHRTTLQVHVGRDREEVELSLSVWGRRPVERLADLGVVDEHLVAIHAVLATGREIKMLAEGGASLAHSPIECVSNLNAVPDLQRFRLAGIPVSLGCDVQANDMFATMHAVWLLQTGHWGISRYDPEYLNAAEVFAMATSESARVLRWDDRIGSLEYGKLADLVVLDGKAPHLMATQDVLTELIRFGTRAEVRQVMVNGRLLFDNGTFTTIDIDRLYAEAAAGAAHIRTITAERRYKSLETLNPLRTTVA